MLEKIGKVVGSLSVFGCLVIRSGVAGTKVYDLDSYEKVSKTTIESVKIRDYLFFETLNIVSTRGLTIDKSLFSLFPIDISLPRRPIRIEREHTSD